MSPLAFGLPGRARWACARHGLTYEWHWGGLDIIPRHASVYRAVDSTSTYWASFSEDAYYLRGKVAGMPGCVLYGGCE